MESYDVVICLGPNDLDIFPKRIANFRENLVGVSKFYIITAATNEPLCNSLGIHFIDERQFPFSIPDIDRILGKSGRAGWYLQQLLKLYACEVIDTLLDNFLIVDVDVYFHRRLTWFEKGKIQFNTGTHIHAPYFQHMRLFTPFLKKKSNISGICHLMPMKRNVARDFLRKCEDLHKKACWIAFLQMVEYYHSGASEYELLFEFALSFYPSLCEIRALKWTNSPSITRESSFDYEACHHYMRG